MRKTFYTKVSYFFFFLMFAFFYSCAHQGQERGNLEKKEDQELELKRTLAKKVHKIPTEAFVILESSSISKEFQRMTGPHKRSYERYMEWGKEYKEMIFKVFEEYHIPKEMIAIPMIESGFRIIKRGPGGVSGIWCFVPATARRFGLMTKEDRLSPEKQTRAAAEFLAELYDEFEDWNWVLLAYNRGDFGVKKLKKRLHDEKLDASLFQNKKIPKSGKDYLAKIHAMVKVMKLSEFVQ